jgi:hypothetical protein
MQKLSVKKLGLATGLTGALLYLGCMVLMTTVGHDGTVKFFNSLLHGLDVTSVVRMEIPLWEAGIGIVETFILGWLIGVCIGALYNWQINNKPQTNNDNPSLK